MEENNNKPNYSKLSLTSLFAMLIQFFVSLILPKIIPNNSSILHFLNNIPWIIISIILAIVSRCKYKDKLSICVLIIDFSVIALISIASIIIFYFLCTSISGCMNFLNEIDFFNKMSACKEIG